MKRPRFEDPGRFALRAAVRMVGTSDAMLILADLVGPHARPPCASRVARQAGTLCDWYVDVAAALAGHRAPPAPAVPDPGLEDGLRRDLRAALRHRRRDAVFATLALAWSALHLEQLMRFGERAARATEELATPAALSPARRPRPAPAPPPPRRSPAG